MAIMQEDRFDAPQPEVKDTEYGARYVTAATETPVAEEVVENVETAGAEVPAESVEPAEKPTEPKKKGGRPRKVKK